VQFTLPSYAKVNLYLEVLGKRPDGYHEIVTVLQTISLFDELTFEDAASGIVLNIHGLPLPQGEKNLIVRAANALRSETGIERGAQIGLRKRIPVGGGLGGGSSNAAVTFIGLTKLWGIDLPIRALEKIAGTLGSDVPFFLRGGTALGTGRGEILEPIDDVRFKYAVITTPRLHISSASAYAGLNAPNLTNTASNRILNVSRAAGLLGGELKNDFEKTVFSKHPEVERAKQKLTRLGAKHALMSGSGASVFGIFDNEETRQAALKALGGETDWRSFAVAAVSRDEYREKLGIAD
jgi:4-diphosphocytidyl-2-C-methyl-D-erythritol kinase